jgi:GNAT superfamily N-acetyltransferase
MSGPEAMREHERNTALLNQELPDERFQDTDYLRWLYDENPHGPGIWESVDEDDGVRVAHYALIPQTWRNAAGAQPLVFSLNAVTHKRAQKSGYFKKLGDQIYERARGDGKQGILAVPNANSTPAALKYWKYQFLMQMPVSIVAPRPGRGGSESYWLDEQFRASDRFTELIQGLDEHPAEGWTCQYTEEYLRWRLAQPHARYGLHVTRDVVAISARSDYRGVPIVVIIKMLPRPGVDTSRPVSGAPAVAAACRHHRTPIALYSGFNAQVKLPDIGLPLRLRPVPLNLIYKSLSDDVPQETFELDTYEFLDMDAF